MHHHGAVSEVCIPGQALFYANSLICFPSPWTGYSGFQITQENEAQSSCIIYTRQRQGLKPGLGVLLTIPLRWNALKFLAQKFWKLLNGMVRYFKI